MLHFSRLHVTARQVIGRHYATALEGAPALVLTIDGRSREVLRAIAARWFEHAAVAASPCSLGDCPRARRTVACARRGSVAERPWATSRAVRRGDGKRRGSRSRNRAPRAGDRVPSSFARGEPSRGQAGTRVSGLRARHAPSGTDLAARRAPRRRAARGDRARGRRRLPGSAARPARACDSRHVGGSTSGPSGTLALRSTLPVLPTTASLELDAEQALAQVLAERDGRSPEATLLRIAGGARHCCRGAAHAVRRVRRRARRHALRPGRRRLLGTRARRGCRVVRLRPRGGGVPSRDAGLAAVDAGEHSFHRVVVRSWFVLLLSLAISTSGAGISTLRGPQGREPPMHASSQPRRT